MATTWRSSGIGIVFCMLASTCAWGSPGDWTRIATERSIAENSPEQREVLEWLHARAAPGLGSPGALRLGVTRVFPGQPELSAAASGMTPGLFPPVTRSEEHTSELQSLMRISYAVFRLKQKKQAITHTCYLHSQLHPIILNDLYHTTII